MRIWKKGLRIVRNCDILLWILCVLSLRCMWDFYHFIMLWTIWYIQILIETTCCRDHTWVVTNLCGDWSCNFLQLICSSISNMYSNANASASSFQKWSELYQYFVQLLVHIYWQMPILDSEFCISILLRSVYALHCLYYSSFTTFFPCSLLQM